MKFARRYRRAVQTGYRSLRRNALAQVPARMRPGAEQIAEHFDLIAVDHHIFRLIYANRHKIGEGVWRSAQPGPAQIRQLAQRGVRTIINLRGVRDCGSYRLEREACAQHNIQLIDFQVRSRGAPERDMLHGAQRLFETVDYPILMHCKSGADRVGLMGVLYLFIHERRPLSEALRQLSLRYGHIKHSDTGILDYFFERYQAHHAAHGTAFFEWVDTVYDPKELRQSFKSRGGQSWGNLLVNRLLRRE